MAVEKNQVTIKKKKLYAHKNHERERKNVAIKIIKNYEQSKAKKKK